MQSLLRDQDKFEKGREEGEEAKAIKVAKKMISKGIPIEEIVEITELRVEEVKRLKNID